MIWATILCVVHVQGDTDIGAIRRNCALAYVVSHVKHRGFDREIEIELDRNNTCEEEARKSIYSVSTKHYFAFGCTVSEEVSYKIKELPRVSWVLPDSYLDAKNRDYGGEPFLNGQTVPYNPKYHEDWVRNNARTNDSRSKRDRPRNFDRSRNSERSDNMQNRDFQGSNGDASPTLNTTQNNRPHLGGPPPYANQNSGPNTGGPTPYANQNSVPNMGVPPSYANHQSNGPNVGGMPPYPSQHNNRPIGTIIPNRPNSGYANISGNMEALPNREFGPKTGFSNTMPNKDFQPRGGSTVPMSNGGDMLYQSREVPTQKYNNYNGNKDNGGAGMASGNACQVRDLPGQDF
ncbi:hypothetical protein GIB67_030107 [Kingdonia uniflora]|uniref:MORF/ORRM1/DAG-like MORF domain-containing protein n=1 Tax=Kingdonia uniflora TaxID=39325 RepID=A0A7J7L2M5_9MAGN|nr:hypothetical protein GIB67_030107 [Kingdonia uniflora]